MAGDAFLVCSKVQSRLTAHRVLAHRHCPTQELDIMSWVFWRSLCKPNDFSSLCSRFFVLGDHA